MNSKLAFLLVLVFGTSFSSLAQESEFDRLKNQMLETNNKLKSARLQTKSFEAAEGQAFSFNKAQIYQNYDESEFDPIANQPLYQWGIIQQFDFPTVYANKLKLNKVKTELAENQYSIIELRQIKNLQTHYQSYLEAKVKLAIYDSIYEVYSEFSLMAKRKFEEGESNYLEKITAESKASQIELDITQLEQDMNASRKAIQALLQTEDSLTLRGNQLEKLELQSVLNREQNLSVSALNLDQKLAEQASTLAKHQLLPGISASYFIRSNSAIDKNFSGYQIGLNVPLLFFGDRSKIKSAELNARAKQADLEDAKITLQQAQEQLINQLSVQQKALTTYKTNQLKIADELLKTARLSYKAGEVDFFRYVQSIEQAQRIKLNYLSKLGEYNQTIIALNYFLLN